MPPKKRPNPDEGQKTLAVFFKRPQRERQPQDDQPLAESARPVLVRGFVDRGVPYFRGSVTKKLWVLCIATAAERQNAPILSRRDAQTSEKAL